MPLWKVYDIFYEQQVIQFRKGYKEFEEAYEELKDELKLKREEKQEGNYILVIVTKGEK